MTRRHLVEEVHVGIKPEDVHVPLCCDLTAHNIMPRPRFSAGVNKCFREDLLRAFSTGADPDWSKLKSGKIPVYSQTWTLTLYIRRLSPAA